MVRPVAAHPVGWRRVGREGYPARVTGPRWTNVVVELAPGDLDSGSAHWADVAPDVPVHPVADGPSRVRLVLHVDDVGRAIVHATEAGASLVDRGDHAELRSPAGVTFHLVAATPGEPRGSGPVAAVVVVPPRSANAELSFWDRVKPSEVRGLDLRVERDPQARRARVDLVVAGPDDRPLRVTMPEWERSLR